MVEIVEFGHGGDRKGGFARDSLSRSGEIVARSPFSSFGKNHRPCFMEDELAAKAKQRGKYVCCPKNNM